jgi:hypothetical protein
MKLFGRLSAFAITGVLAATAFVPAAGAAPRAHVAAVNHGYTELVLDQATAQALTSLGVTVTPINPAWVYNGGVAFPITNGLLGILASGLTIDHSGGLALSAGNTTVDLTDFDISLPQRQLTAVVNGGARVAILDLKFAGAKIGYAGGQVSIGPVTADLTAAAASALDTAFGTTAITPGLELGTATVNLQLF